MRRDALFIQFNNRFIRTKSEVLIPHLSKKYFSGSFGLRLHVEKTLSLTASVAVAYIVINNNTYK